MSSCGCWLRAEHAGEEGGAAGLYYGGAGGAAGAGAEHDFVCFITVSKRFGLVGYKEVGIIK